MRILIATPYMSSHLDSGLFWARAINQLGHSITLWDYRYDQRTNFSRGFDLSIVFKGEVVDPKLLPGTKLIYWPDKFERTPGIIKDKLSLYDKIFTPVRPTPEGMVWLPSGHDKDVHKDMLLERFYKSVYIGTLNSEYKHNMVYEIGPSKVFGNGWDSYCHEGPVYLDEFVRTANYTKVLIDIHQSPDTGVNRKLFEMISCGFTIVDRVPGIKEIFPDIWAKFTFEDSKTAKELINYYLADYSEALNLWELQKKCIEPYSYLNCAKKMLKGLN